MGIFRPHDRTRHLARLTRTAWIVFSIGMVAGSSVLAQDGYDVTKQKNADQWRDATNAGTVGVITKGLGCTCTTIASDMAEVMNQIGTLRVLPVIGQGPLQGIADVLYLRGIDISIVPSDVLVYIKKNNLHSNIEARLRYITSLYNSELHLIGGPNIKSIQDLEGKVVSFDEKERGVFITAQTILEHFNIKVKPVYLERDKGVDKIRSGEIAAAFVVTGAPAASLQKIPAGEGLRFVPIPFDLQLEQIYLPTELSSKQYPNLIAEGQTVPTVAIGEVMAVYNWEQDSPRYHHLDKFISMFFDNFKKFHEGIRHPKWKEVNLAATVPGWIRFTPAAQKLKNQISQTRVDKSKEQFEEFLENTSSFSSASEKQKEKLYLEFMQWKRQEARQ